jgi:hypothetical protein
MKKNLLFLFLTGMFFVSQAQDSTVVFKSKREKRNERIKAIIKQEEEGVLRYTRHFASGIKLTNDGYGGFVEVGRARNVNASLLFQLEITERKHVKEEKLQNDYSPTAPVIYGKINYFYPVKLGAQYQLLLGNKGNKNGVCVTSNFGGGLSMALLRPYLVQVDKGGGVYEFVGYNSPDSNYFINGPIIGGPGLSKGWSGLKVTPGLYAKAAVRFDYGKYNEMVNAIEIGGTFEYYFKKIQQMIVVKQYSYFLGAYVGIVFGKRK